MVKGNKLVMVKSGRKGKWESGNEKREELTTDDYMAEVGITIRPGA